MQLLSVAVLCYCLIDITNGRNWLKCNWYSCESIGCFFPLLSAFTCQEKGVFANTDANDCKTYVTCNTDLNPVVHNCVGDTYFWPAKKGCFSQYDCAMGNAPPDNIDPCHGEIFISVPDKSSADCTKYFECTLPYAQNGGDGFNIPHVTRRQCPSGTSFRPGLHCTTQHRCSTYQCTAEGLFENPNDCTSFIKCWKRVDIAPPSPLLFLFADLNYCPSGTKFNPHLKKCDSFYECNGIDPHGGVDPCLGYNWNHPLIENTVENDASSYIVCVHNFQANIGVSDVIILKKKCPAGSRFSPLLRKCYDRYKPNETCIKDPCHSGPGKYVNYKSGKCATYIECRDESKDLEVYRPTYEIRHCPPGTKYSPQTTYCQSQYVCPQFPVNYCYPKIPTTTPAPGVGAGSN